MVGHHAEHAGQTATLRWVALGILIQNAFFVGAAPWRSARCRYSAIQSNAPTARSDTVAFILPSIPLVGALAPAVLMSGVADSRRKSGHGNIDANDPTETWGAAVVYLAGMPRNANIHSGSRVIGKNP